MVSVTSASCYIMSASHYHLCYQSRSSMYILGLIPSNFAELAKAVPIVNSEEMKTCFRKQLCFCYHKSHVWQVKKFAFFPL